MSPRRGRKIRCRGTADLERVISEEIKSLGGVVRTYTIIVMSTAKETTFVPLASDGARKRK